MKIDCELKRTCGNEKVVQLGSVCRGFSRHANGKRVIVINLRYFSE